MARPAPGARRSVDVLRFLAARPDERFTLSEVARGCGLNKATAHALLSALTEHAVLLRHPDEKRYSLGPRLVELGEAARWGYRAEDFAPRELERLAVATGRATAAAAKDGDSMTIVAAASAAGMARTPASPPLPLVPPVGVGFMAWDRESSIEAWLARAPVSHSVASARAALETSRAAGYTLVPASPDWAELARVLGATPEDGTGPSGGLHDGARAVLARLGELPAMGTVTPDSRYAIDSVAAPVFDASGEVCLVLSVAELGGSPLPGGHLLELASAVQASAAALTMAVGGPGPRLRPGVQKTGASSPP